MEEIEVEAFLADHVVESQRKLYANGAGWNVLRVREFPGRLPPFGIGVIIHVPYTETNANHEFEVRLESADGDIIPIQTGQQGSKITANFKLGRPPELEAGEEQLVPLAINLVGVELPASGTYRFAITIDGFEKRPLRFKAVAASAAQPPPG